MGSHEQYQSILEKSLAPCNAIRARGNDATTGRAARRGLRFRRWVIETSLRARYYVYEILHTRLVVCQNSIDEYGEGIHPSLVSQILEQPKEVRRGREMDIQGDSH